MTGRSVGKFVEVRFDRFLAHGYSVCGCTVIETFVKEQWMLDRVVGRWVAKHPSNGKGPKKGWNDFHWKWMTSLRPTWRRVAVGGFGFQPPIPDWFLSNVGVVLAE